MADDKTPASQGKKPVAVVDRLTAGYGENIVLEDVSLEVFPGEILVILGESGCGKSTLLKQMIGIYQPFAGQVLINGINIHTADETEQVKLRRQIGVTFQAGALFGSMTLGENVALPLQEYTDLPEEEIDRIVKMKLGMVNLGGYENHLPEELSGGMQKRAGLARALALDPKVLFFDEPSAGLDPVTAAEIDILIKGINAGMGITMVVVTHELQSIFNIAHRVIMIDREARGLIAEGDPRELQEHSQDSRVHNFFNRLPSRMKEREL
ncbi:MAG: ATP-binding cassette domain-containing protein [Syntrophobacterales bacterium]|nr:ATP-binding cassette domain-containing protein [Syntrophobacterales bacterium]